MKLAWLLLLVFLTACSRELPEHVVELVYASQYSPAHPFSKADQEWIDYIQQNSNGTLRIKPNWSGALLSADHSMIELRHGIADIGLITPIYVKGGTHLIRIQSGFYSGTTTVETQVALYHCLEASNEQFARELEGLHILAIQGGSLPGIITTKVPINSLDDLKGMRLRAPTELLNVLKLLGADPVNMPMGDVYSALAKGILDGVVAPLDTFKALHFAEVTQYYADLEIPRGAYPARAMSTQRWSQLSPAHQQLLSSGEQVWEAALARQVELGLEEGRETAIASGVVFTHIAPEEQQRFEMLYLEMARQNAASLSNYGIDGDSVFAVARASVGADGVVTCSGDSN